MKNYYEFTKFDENGLAIDIFNAMTDKKLGEILDNYFNEIDAYLDLFANTFKSLFIMWIST